MTTPCPSSTDLQSDRRMALIRLWDAMFRGARRYVETHGFVAVHNAPEIVGITGACENVDTLFALDYFGRQAYLAQSDQLYLELITPKIPRVYAEIQSFRMEPEPDDRHLCQFSLFEIEHQGDLDELMGHITGIVREAVGAVLMLGRNVYRQLGIGDRQEDVLLAVARGIGTFERMTYDEAVDRLQPDFPELMWGDDLKAHHERRILQLVGNQPLFLTHYPLPIKFFNMKQNADDPRVVNSTDLLLPFAGESAGAAEREHTHDTLVKRLKSSVMYERLIARGGTDADFAWYLDAHQDKDIPLHAGAGIGMARLAQFMLGCSDIREATPFLLNRDHLL